MHSRAGDVRPDAADGFVKADRDRKLQILPALSGLRILPGNDIFEDFAEIALVRTGEGETLKLEAPIGSHTTLFHNPVGVDAIDVIEFRLQRLAENVVY